jgi:hypothetical protein
LGRQGQIEPVEHQRLIGLELGVAWHDQPTAVGGRQTDIQHLERRQVFQHRSRGEAGGQGLQPLFERYRKSEGEEGHQDVGFDAVF